jgi:hypothetical protein
MQESERDFPMSPGEERERMEGLRENILRESSPGASKKEQEPKGPCAVPGCETPVEAGRASGMCRAHEDAAEKVYVEEAENDPRLEKWLQDKNMTSQGMGKILLIEKAQRRLEEQTPQSIEGEDLEKSAES